MLLHGPRGAEAGGPRLGGGCPLQAGRAQEGDDDIILDGASNNLSDLSDSYLATEDLSDSEDPRAREGRSAGKNPLPPPSPQGI